MKPVTRPGVARYAAAVTGVTLAAFFTYLAYLAWPALASSPTPLFFAAVMVSAWYGGLGPGLLATALATLLMDYAFMPPYLSFSVAVNDLISLVAFVSVAVLTSSLNARRQRAETELRTAQEKLEGRVEERTAELSRANATLQGEVTERKRMAETAKVLADIGRLLTQSLEPDVVARRIADSVRDLLGARTSALYRLEPASGDLVAIAVSGDVGPAFRTRLVFPAGTGVAGLAVRLREPVATPDLLADDRITLTPDLRARISQARYRAVLAVPLAVQDRVRGALAVGDDEGREFHPPDIGLLQAFADQAALALENAQLFERGRRERRRLRVLYDLGRRLASAHDTDETLSLIVNEAVRLLGADAAALRLLEGGELVLKARTELAAELVRRRRLKLGESLSGLVVETGQPVVTEDIVGDTRYDQEHKRAAVALGFHGFVGVPLRTQHRTVGALSVFSKRRRRFTEDETALLAAFADQAALAIEQDTRTRRLRALARLNQIVSSSLDSREVLSAIATAAAELMGAPVVSIWIADEEAKILYRGAFSDEAVGADYPSAVRRFGEGGNGWVAVHRRPLNVPDVFADDRIVSLDWFRRHGLRSSLSVPILFGDSLLGVLVLFGQQPFDLGADDQELLESFVAQAAVAIRNAGLYEQLRTAHRRLASSQAQLVQSERLRALGEMAAGVAHDFNNLLAVIVGRAQLLLRRVRDREIAQGLEAINQAGLDGAQTVRRIQEFTRTRRTRSFESVDLDRALREVVQLASLRWKDEAQSLGVRYDVRVDGDAAPPVAGRPEELREVFMNLLTNALEAMPGGGECVFEVKTDGDAVAVSVRDTGCGMTEETARRVFEPFFTTKGPRGNGLGLAVAWGIVTRHGGTIEVESKPGTGTVFTVRLPIQRESSSAVTAPPAPAVVRHARVLVIEDEAPVRAVLVDALTGAGYSVVEAADGREGLACCGRERFDLVLSDLSMPGMSGWDIAKVCRERWPETPLAFVTGWGDQLDPALLAKHQVRFVVAKPFDADHLRRQVAEVLSEAPHGEKNPAA